jgi:hypothetical protein
LPPVRHPARGFPQGLRGGLIPITPEQREELIRLLQQGEDFSPEWAPILFPPEKREYELVYHGKAREEDILANTPAALREALLPKLISGEMRVKEAERFLKRRGLG